MTSIDSENSLQDDDNISNELIGDINKTLLLLNKYDHLVRTVNTDLDTIGKSKIKEILDHIREVCILFKKIVYLDSYLIFY